MNGISGEDLVLERYIEKAMYRIQNDVVDDEEEEEEEEEVVEVEVSPERM